MTAVFFPLHTGANSTGEHVSVSFRPPSPYWAQSQAFSSRATSVPVGPEPRRQRGVGRTLEGRGRGEAGVRAWLGPCQGQGPCGHLPGLSPALHQTSQARGPPSPRWHLQSLVQGTELATHRHSWRWTDEKSLDPLLSQWEARTQTTAHHAWFY